MAMILIHGLHYKKNNILNFSILLNGCVHLSATWLIFFRSTGPPIIFIYMIKPSIYYNHGCVYHINMFKYQYIYIYKNRISFSCCKYLFDVKILYTRVATGFGPQGPSSGIDGGLMVIEFT